MHIGIDLRCLPSDGSPGAGIAHAAKALSKALVALPNQDIRWTMFMPKGAAPGAEDWLVRQKPISTHIIRLDHAGGAALRRALARTPIDLLFVPSGAIPPGIRCPTVPWVHDIAIFDHPEWFSEPFMRRAVTTSLFRHGVMRSKRVLCVSEFTKQELQNRFGLKGEQIVVTNEGGDPVLSGLEGEALLHAKQRARYRVAERGISNPYILCMGTIEPRKNIPMLLDAWLRAREKFNHPVDILVAGRDGWKMGPILHALKEGWAAPSENGSRLHRIEMPTDEDRRDQLLGAQIVAVPSLHEGFGLVALEGMQAGSAVLTSNAGALPEVVGSDGISISPQDVEAWERALIRVMDNEVSRRALAEKGKERSRAMTWEKAAGISLEVLLQAASRSV